MHLAVPSFRCPQTMTGLPPPAADPRPVFVTGASGYIGGRLVPRLLEAGYAVRCLARAPRKLAHRPWASHPRLQIVTGDVGDPEAQPACSASSTWAGWARPGIT
jgi:NAD(P)-dependent dehydrogenase (short-subunit alcohol dehydrogenase family)